MKMLFMRWIGRGYKDYSIKVIFNAHSFSRYQMTRMNGIKCPPHDTDLTFFI